MESQVNGKKLIISSQLRHPLMNIGQCGDCDCACTFTPLLTNTLSPSRAVDESYVVPEPFWDQPIDDRHSAIWGVNLPISVTRRDVLAVIAHFREPTIPNTLTQEAIVSELMTSGVIAPQTSVTALPKQTNSILSAWLHITDRCNLSCDYCYLPRTTSRMSFPTGQAAIDATLRSAAIHRYRAVKLKYAGGEPLLRFPFVIRLHRYAQRQMEKHSLQELDGVILSNGTLLTSQMVEQMLSANLRLMISLDGIGANHDCQRHYPDGRGSYEQVARAVELALTQGLVPEISVTVSGRNAGGLPEIVRWVLERDLPFSLNFYRESEQSCSQTDLRSENEHIVEGMLSAYKVIEEMMPRRSLLASLMDRANLSAPHLRACSIGQSYLVFDTQGNIASCPMNMRHSATDINDSDPLTAVRSMAGIQNPSVDEIPECEDCRWRYWCGGGCPLQAHRFSGRYDAKSPYCVIYKSLFPEVVRLEGLRLLKYANELPESSGFSLGSELVPAT